MASSTTSTSTVNLVSFSNTPQAKDDLLYGTTEALLEQGYVITLNVMANDLGGKAKTLYSVDDGTNVDGTAASTATILQDLSASDLTNGASLADGTTAEGALLRIVNGKVEVKADAAYLAKVNAMGAGETFTDSFVYAIQLGNGTLSWARVTFTIAGSNDGVVLVGNPITEAVVEDASLTESPDDSLTASGTIAFSDADLSDTHTATFTAAPANTTSLGTFSLSAVAENSSSAAGTVNWTYALDNSAAQYLGAGERVTETYQVTITDQHGTSAVQTVSITITGDNDQVQIDSAVLAGDAAEDSGDYGAAGTIHFSDVDLIDTHAVTVTPGASDYLGSFTTTLQDSNGTGNGQLDWAFTADNADLQFLGEGQTLTQTYQVAIGDGAVQTVSITITGDNDQVQIDSAVLAGDAAEDSGDYGAAGTIHFSDVDLIDTHAVTVTPGASDYLGSFTTTLQDSNGTGNGQLDWAFTADNADLQFLGEGQTLTQTYQVAIGDGAVQTVSITITGDNDAPTVSGAVTGIATEDGAASTLNALAHASDLDAGTTLSVVDVPGELPAGVTYDAASQSFRLDPTVSAYQSLTAGQSDTVTVSYGVSDGSATTAASVTWTVTGTNDGAVITGNRTGTVTEDDPVSNTTGGTLAVSDADDGEAGFAALDVAALDKTYGTFTFNETTGAWTYTLDNSRPAVQALAAGQTVVDMLTVTSLDGSASRDITVTITGADEPVVGHAPTGINFTATNWLGGDTLPGANTVIATMSAIDEDIGDTFTFAFAGGATSTTVSDTTFTLAGTSLSSSGLSANSTYTLSIVATDSTNQSVTETLNIITGKSTGNGSDDGSAADDIIYTMGSGTTGNQKDVVFAGSGNDTVFGQDGIDELHGDAGDDVLYGGAGNDQLNGGADNDKLDGGAGNDTLTGGTGIDTFVFSTALNIAGTDHITDYGNGSDILLLSKTVFAGLGTAGSSDGTQLSTADFAGVASGGGSANVGAAHIIYDASTGNLYYDADGGSNANRTLFAVLDNKPSLQGLDASDFKVIL